MAEIWMSVPSHQVKNADVVSDIHPSGKVVIC